MDILLVSNDDTCRSRIAQELLNARFYFDDSFKKRGLSESEQEQQVSALYKEMYYQLYEFYRDELSEQLMPRCTCGANVYCRCE